VKTVGQQGVEEGRKKGGLDSVHRLPHRVRDVVGTRGGGVRGLRKGPGDLFRGQGSVILIAREAEERGRRGFGGKKVLTTVTESPTYRLFTLTTLTLVTHNSSHAVL